VVAVALLEIALVAVGLGALVVLRTVMTCPSGKIKKTI
jgi:hypothetical protein